MVVIYLTLAVLAGAGMWPINRYVMRTESSSSLFGFWTCLTTAIVAAVVAVIWGESPVRPWIWVLSAVMAAAHVTGYWLIVMYCLRIGPVGPTAAVNNTGFIWPVVLEATWLRPHPVNTILIAGIVIVCSSLVCMGTARSKGCANATSATAQMTARWFAWIMLGWVLSGVAQTAQVAAAIHAPETPAGNVFAMWSISALLLGLLNLTKVREFVQRRRERRAGMLTGALLSVTVICMLAALRHVGAEIVFSIALGGTTVIVLLLGWLWFHERLSWAGWTAGALGVVGIVLLAVGQVT